MNNRIYIALGLFLISASACNTQNNKGLANTVQDTAIKTAPAPVRAYAKVNGINMYYEIHGQGEPLVLIHGGGSTIKTNFGTVLPTFARTHKVIAVELQSHGHTSNRDTFETFEQDADDVAELLRQLGVAKADIMGFSNGGNTAMQIAYRHPELPRKLVLASSFYKKEGMQPGFWEGMMQAKFSDMPQVYKDEFLKIRNSQDELLAMFHNDSHRMQTFKDWSPEVLKAINVPALVIQGDQDVMTNAHALEMSKLLPKGRLTILYGNHGSYIGEVMSSAKAGSRTPEFAVALINEFLAE